MSLYAISKLLTTYGNGQSSYSKVWTVEDRNTIIDSQILGQMLFLIPCDIKQELSFSNDSFLIHK